MFLKSVTGVNNLQYLDFYPCYSLTIFTRPRVIVSHVSNRGDVNFLGEHRWGKRAQKHRESIKQVNRCRVPQQSWGSYPPSPLL